MKKLLCLTIVVTMAISMLLTGCGGKTDTGGLSAATTAAPAQSTAAVTQAVTEAGKEPVTIRISFYGGTTPTEKMYEIMDNFKALYPYITIEPTASDWTGHYEKLKAQLAARAAPTVYLLDGPYVPQYQHNGVLEELTARVNSDIDTSKYYGIDAVKFPDGKIWGLPQGIQVNVLFYNKAMFDEAGVAYPTADWTTDDVVAAAQKLTNDKHWGLSLPNHIRYGWYTTIRMFGGDCLDQTRTKSIIASDPLVKEALRYMHDVWYKYKVSPTLQDAEGKLGAKYATYFERGKVAMCYDCYQLQLKATEANLNFDVQIVPKGTNAEGRHFSSFVANCWVMDKNAKDAEKDAGWEFIKYYMSDDAQKIHAEVGESLPANIKICNDVILNMPGGAPTKKVFLDSMQYTGTLGENACWEEWFVAFQTVLADYLNNKITLDEAITKGDTEVKKVLEQYY